MTNDRNVEEEGEGTKICKSCVWINLFLSTQITNHQINKDSLGLNLGHVKRSTKMTDNLSWDMPETEFVDSVQLILTAAPQWRGNLPCANSLFIFPQLAREQSDKYSFLIPIFIWSHLFSWWKSLMPPAKKATTNGQHYGLWAREKGLKETQESKKNEMFWFEVFVVLCVNQAEVNGRSILEYFFLGSYSNSTPTKNGFVLESIHGTKSKTDACHGERSLCDAMG